MINITRINIAYIKLFESRVRSGLLKEPEISQLNVNKNLFHLLKIDQDKNLTNTIIIHSNIEIYM